MGIAIPFEIVRQDKPETDVETRIHEKEAIYRGLIEKEAVRLGKPFEEMYDIITAAQTDNEERLKQEGIVFNGYEATLDRRNKFLRYFVEKFAPLIPEGVHIGW